METIAKNQELVITYLNENNETFRIEKVREQNFDLLNSQRETLDKGLNLGRLLSEAIANFNDPINKQLRKEKGLKISVEYFLSQAYNMDKSWCYRLVKAYELPNETKEAFRNSGISGKELSVMGLLNFAKPKKDAMTTETEATETETETEADAIDKSYDIAIDAYTETFGTVKLLVSTENDGKVVSNDILKAIDYLNSLLTK